MNKSKMRATRIVPSGNPRIAVFGAFGSGNLGNECTLYALLENLRQSLPNASFCCVCTGPEDAATIHGIPAIPIRPARMPQSRHRLARALAKAVYAIPVELYRWFKVLRSVKGMDMLVMTGTGMLSDVGLGPMGLTHDILRWALAARLCRCKVLFVSVGVGPILHPLSRLFVKAALSLANFRSYRDEFSRDYLASIRFQHDRDDVYPDLAFSLPRAMTSREPMGDRPGRVVGLGVIAHSRRRATSQNDETLYQEYMAKLATFAAGLIRQGSTVRLLIGDMVYDRTARADLLATLDRMGVTYTPSQVIDQPAISFEDLLSQLVATDVVVASRFHNVLLSLALNKPVIAISFHEKVDALMRAAKMERFRQDIEDIDVNRLTAQLADLETNADFLKQQIQQTTEVWRLSLEHQYRTIAEMAEGRDLISTKKSDDRVMVRFNG